MGKSLILISLKLLTSGLTEFEKDGILTTTFIEIIEKNEITENIKIIASGRSVERSLYTSRVLPLIEVTIVWNGQVLDWS